MAHSKPAVSEKRKELPTILINRILNCLYSDCNGEKFRGPGVALPNQRQLCPHKRDLLSCLKLSRQWFYFTARHLWSRYAGFRDLLSLVSSEEQLPLKVSIGQFPFIAFLTAWLEICNLQRVREMGILFAAHLESEAKGPMRILGRRESHQRTREPSSWQTTSPSCHCNRSTRKVDWVIRRSVDTRTSSYSNLS